MTHDAHHNPPLPTLRQMRPQMVAACKFDSDSCPGGFVASYGAGIGAPECAHRWDAVYIGSGRSPRAAAEDAIEQAAMSIEGPQDTWGFDYILQREAEELDDSESACEEFERDAFAEFCRATNPAGLVNPNATLGPSFSDLSDREEAEQAFYDACDDPMEIACALYVRFGPPESIEHALARHLDIDPDDVAETDYSGNYGHGTVYDAGGLGEYVVYIGDDAADKATREYILESLWAFRPDFLAAHMPEGIGPDEIRMIVGDRCEDANDAMIALVRASGQADLRGEDAINDLVRDAIMADGRGHFLSQYDGEEIELEISVPRRFAGESKEGSEDRVRRDLFVYLVK